MEQLRTKEQSKILFGLLAKLNWTHLRKNLVLSITQGRVSSTKDMLEGECQELIDYLKSESRSVNPKKTKTQLDKMRGKFFYYCHELNWKKGRKLDYNRIKNWLTKYGYLHKPLDDYTEKQMYKLLQQIEKVLDKQKAK